MREDSSSYKGQRAIMHWISGIKKGYDVREACDLFPYNSCHEAPKNEQVSHR